MCESVVKYADEKAERAAKEAAIEAAREQQMEAFKNAIEMGLTIEQAKKISGISEELVEEILQESK